MSKHKMTNTITMREKDSLVQAVLYNDSIIFISPVNKNLVNSLINKGFVKKYGVVAKATDNVIALVNLDRGRAFDEILVR